MSSAPEVRDAIHRVGIRLRDIARLACRMSHFDPAIDETNSRKKNATVAFQ